MTTLTPTTTHAKKHAMRHARTPPSGETCNLIARIPAWLRREVRLAAIREERTLQAYVALALTEALARVAQEPG